MHTFVLGFPMFDFDSIVAGDIPSTRPVGAA